MLREIFWDLVFPPKGIIYFEFQVLLWIYALTKTWIVYHAADLLILGAIIFVIAFCVLGRTNFHVRGGTIRRIFDTILRVLVNIAFAWFFLIYGAVRADVAGNAGENIARVNYSRRVRTSTFGNVVYNFTRLSIHFHIGRGLFRLAYRLLGYIPYMRDNEVIHRRTARGVALFIILWGVWRIPYDLTH